MPMGGLSDRAEDGEDGKTARDFLEKLTPGLQPKFDAEIAEFKKMKAQETAESDPKSICGTVLLQQ